MMKDSNPLADDLMGLLLLEEARLEQDHLLQTIAISSSLNTSAPLALNVNRHQPR